MWCGRWFWLWEECTARKHRLDCLEQIAGRVTLGDGTSDRVTLKMLKQVLSQMQGKQNDGYVGLMVRDLCRGFDSVHHRHGYIHDDDVRKKLQGLFDGLSPVRRVGANTPTRAVFYQIADSQSHDFVVVNHENANT
jgi:hypothetical protein